MFTAKKASSIVKGDLRDDVYQELVLFALKKHIPAPQLWRAMINRAIDLLRKEKTRREIPLDFVKIEPKYPFSDFSERLTKVYFATDTLTCGQLRFLYFWIDEIISGGRLWRAEERAGCSRKYGSKALIKIRRRLRQPHKTRFKIVETLAQFRRRIYWRYQKKKRKKS